MPKWTEYTSKDTLADNDEVMLYDATGKVNKRGLMSKFGIMSWIKCQRLLSRNWRQIIRQSSGR